MDTYRPPSPVNDQLIEEMSSMMHVLKGTLTVMVGYAEMLTDPSHGAISPAKVMFAERIQASGRDLRRQLSNISMLGHIEACTFQHRPARFDLHPLIADLAQPDVHVEATPGLTVHGDRVNLQLVLDNLVSNGLRHSPARASTGLMHFGADLGPRVRVVGAVEGTDVVVSVTNNGPRIPSDQVPLLFKKFGRLPGHVGLGLGLYVVERVLAAHGSEPSLQSDDRATTLTFRLPLR